jgi:coenzyme F420-reducing hydrogenase beta subunit
MQSDRDGFYYPVKNETLCKNCGMCITVCPTHQNITHSSIKDALAVISKDANIYSRGSSGGVFESLARLIQNKGGKVYGAVFDANLQLRHVGTKTHSELLPLCKSKYIQSNTQGAFYSVRNDLFSNDNQYILFVGTPCQCAALRNFLRKDYKNLFIVDFVCHGVPSQKLFNQSIKWFEEKHGCRVINFEFRYKPRKIKSLQCFRLEYITDNQRKQKIGLSYEFPFYFGFQRYLTLRPACYKCSWANIQRPGDITLGDFWGIEKYIKIDSTRGVSMVLLNNQKGKQLFSEIESSFIISRVPIEYAIKENGCLSSPTKLLPLREDFFNDLTNLSFDEVVKKYLISRNARIFKIYYGMPRVVRKVLRKIIGNKVVYE